MDFCNTTCVSSAPTTSPFAGWGAGGALNKALSANFSANRITIDGREIMQYRIIRENKDYIFEIIAPAFDADDISVSIDRMNIHISRKKHEQKGDEVYSPYGFSIVSDAMLDIKIKDYELRWKKAISKYENGIITITIPRLNPAIALLTK